MHVIALGNVKDEREEEPPALTVEVAKHCRQDQGTHLLSGHGLSLSSLLSLGNLSWHI